MPEYSTTPKKHFFSKAAPADLNKCFYKAGSNTRIERVGFGLYV